MPLLEVEDVFLRFGGIVALNGVGFEVHAGEVCGLIGPNGAGKTTLFNCITGLYAPQRGRISFDQQDLLAMPPHRIIDKGIARTFQNIGLFPSLSVRDNLLLGAYHRRPPLGGGRAAERELRAEADALIAELGLQQLSEAPLADLTLGTLKRVELARALLARPRLLMLDEPANGLTHSEVDELGDLILQLRERYSLAVVLVEHHMRMVMRLSDHIVGFDSGRKIFDGSSDAAQKSDELIRAYLGTTA